MKKVFQTLNFSTYPNSENPFKFFFKKVYPERKNCELVLKNYFKTKSIPRKLLFSYFSKTVYFNLFHPLEYPILEKEVSKNFLETLNLFFSPQSKNFIFSVVFPEPAKRNSENFFQSIIYNLKKLKNFFDKKLLEFIYPVIFQSEVCEKLFKFTPLVSNSIVFLFLYSLNSDFFSSASNLIYLNIPFLPIYYAFHVKNKALDKFSLVLKNTIKEASFIAFDKYLLLHSEEMFQYIYFN
ncbi:MAG: hypothetical protein ACK4J0_03880 [Candidatus Anstonellaceae archaeon]